MGLAEQYGSGWRMTEEAERKHGQHLRNAGMGRP
jgi:hypothetical protein